MWNILAYYILTNSGMVHLVVIRTNNTIYMEMHTYRRSSIYVRSLYLPYVPTYYVLIRDPINLGWKP